MLSHKHNCWGFVLVHLGCGATASSRNHTIVISSNNMSAMQDMAQVKFIVPDEGLVAYDYYLVLPPPRRGPARWPRRPGSRRWRASGRSTSRSSLGPASIP